MAFSLSNPFLQNNVRSPISSIRKVAVTAKPGQPKVTCRKKDIHPEIYDDAKVYCSGEHVLTVCGTKKEYVVDVWAGNHPFYLGKRTDDILDADQVEKFRRKYGGEGGLLDMMEIPVLKGEIVLPPRPKSGRKKK